MTSGFSKSFHAKESPNPITMFFATAYTVAGAIIGIGVGLTIADFLWKIDNAVSRRITWLKTN